MRAYRGIALISTAIFAAWVFSAGADDMSGGSPWTKDELIKKLDVQPEAEVDFQSRGIKPKETEQAEEREPKTGPAEERARVEVGVVDDLRVLFAFDSAELTGAAREQLDVFAAALESPQLRDDRFLIAGHTDAVGDEAYNLSLSRRRAESVVEYLIRTHGISRDRLLGKGYGESQLFDPSDPSSGVNRRVEVVNGRLTSELGSDISRQ